MLSLALVLVALLANASRASAVDWIRPGLSTNQPVWGIRGGLLWAVAPAGFRTGEPRGLIRLGYPVLPEGRYDLINFIAVEPIVRGGRGFSEPGDVRTVAVPSWLVDLDAMEGRSEIAGSLCTGSAPVFPGCLALVDSQLLHLAWLGVRQIKFWKHIIRGKSPGIFRGRSATNDQLRRAGPTHLGRRASIQQGRSTFGRGIYQIAPGRICRKNMAPCPRHLDGRG